MITDNFESFEKRKVLSELDLLFDKDTSSLNPRLIKNTEPRKI